MTVENSDNPSSYQHADRYTAPHRAQDDIKRAGGHLLDVVFIAPTEQTKPEIVELVRQENEIIDMRKNAHRVNLFRQKSLEHVDHAQRAALMEQFESELARCHTMSERFGLFMDERYADEVYTLDLGETLEAGSHDAVESIKDEYHVLEARLVSEGVIDGEMPRNVAMPTIHFGKSKSDNYCLGTRNRNLFSFVRDGRVITVAKRMTFLMALDAMPDALDRKPDTEYTTNMTQKLIDTRDAAIVPVRTVYYATNKELKT